VLQRGGDEQARPNQAAMRGRSERAIKYWWFRTHRRLPTCFTSRLVLRGRHQCPLDHRHKCGTLGPLHRAALPHAPPATRPPLQRNGAHLPSSGPIGFPWPERWQGWPKRRHAPDAAATARPTRCQQRRLRGRPLSAYVSLRRHGLPAPLCLSTTHCWLAVHAQVRGQHVMSLSISWALSAQSRTPGCTPPRPVPAALEDSLIHRDPFCCFAAAGAALERGSGGARCVAGGQGALTPFGAGRSRMSCFKYEDTFATAVGREHAQRGGCPDRVVRAEVARPAASCDCLGCPECSTNDTKTF
jgi:hypothetical protein